MKNRLTKDEARAILARCGIALNDDYHKIPSEQVFRLRDEAHERGYRKPRQANGSLTRCFHAYLVRTMRSLTA